MELLELKEALKVKYIDIWDVVYDAQKSKLLLLEKEIERLWSSDSEAAQTLLAGYYAEIELSARSYRDKVGNKFHVHLQNDFIKEALDKKQFFDASGNYLGVRDNSVHSIPTFGSHTMDLCFGDPLALTGCLVSEIYIPMRRPDYSDWKILNLLAHIRETKGFNLETIKYLVNSKIAVIRKDR